MAAFNFRLRKASTNDIALIRDLSYRIWPLTYSDILTSVQIDYMMNLLYSPDSLLTQMNQEHEFIIIQEADIPVGFASYSLIAPRLFKLHKLYLLPSTQGKGAGKFVINSIIGIIKEKGANA